LISADKGYTPLNLTDNIISDIVELNIPDTIANIKQKSLDGRYFKELEQPEINIQAAHGCINVVVYVCECKVEWAWVAGESAPEPRRITDRQRNKENELEKRPTERYRKSRMAKNGNGNLKKKKKIQASHA
jgi:hypothetical protein